MYCGVLVVFIILKDNVSYNLFEKQCIKSTVLFLQLNTWIVEYFVANLNCSCKVWQPEANWKAWHFMSHQSFEDVKQTLSLHYFSLSNLGKISYDDYALCPLLKQKRDIFITLIITWRFLTINKRSVTILCKNSIWWCNYKLSLPFSSKTFWVTSTVTVTFICLLLLIAQFLINIHITAHCCALGVMLNQTQLTLLTP